MEQNNVGNLESGFIIKNILLAESHFFRINDVKFGEGIDAGLNIDTEVSVNGNNVTVSETVTVSQKHDGTEQVHIKVRMIGLFERVGKSLIENLNDFGRINGAAIIYPYIRSHITDLTTKAGIGAVILPPVNFTNNRLKK